MGELPVLKPQELGRILERLGFLMVLQRGSHRQCRHVDSRVTAVPFHQGRVIAPTLLKLIIKDIGLTTEALLACR
jgi:predicted RNA binding protein YcfA (HicA-like mRNA interferase family)